MQALGIANTVLKRTRTPVILTNTSLAIYRFCPVINYFRLINLICQSLLDKFII
jgi:hypothetical protein